MQCYLWCQELLFLITCLAMCLVSTTVFVFFGDLVSYHSLTLPVVILAVCGVLGFLVTCLVHYQRFCGDDQSRCCLIMVGVVFICCGLGSLVFLASFTRKPNHVGKMSAYLNVKQHKRMIDKTQMLLRCCGDVDYSDWFKVDWQGFESVAWGQMPPSDVISRTAVPFSCCSPKAMPPCVHNYLQLDKDAKLYRGGCKEVIVLVASVFLFVMAASLVITGVFMLQWGYCCRDEVEDTEYEVASTYTDDKTELVEVSSDSCSGGSATEDGANHDAASVASLTSITQETTTASTGGPTATPTPDVATTQESEYESTGAEDPLTNETETEKEMGNVNMGADSANETDRETDVQTGDETGNDTETDAGNVTEDETTGNETDRDDNVDSSAVETDKEEVTDQEGDTDGGSYTDGGGDTDGGGITDGAGDTDVTATEGRGDANTDDEKSWPRSDPSTEGEPAALTEDDVRTRLAEEGVAPDTDATSGEESRPPDSDAPETSEAAEDGGGGGGSRSYVVAEADDRSASNTAFARSAEDSGVVVSLRAERTNSQLSLKSEDLSNKAMDGSNTEATAVEPTSEEEESAQSEDAKNSKNKSLKWGTPRRK